MHQLLQYFEDPEVAAAGVWRRSQEHLEQLAFAASSRLPPEVRRDFASATQLVPLTRNDLGIVRAVRTGKNVIVDHQQHASDLSGSAQWLQRFTARSSYSMPYVSSTGETTVIAVALNVALSADDNRRGKLETLARQIASKLGSQSNR